MGPVRFANSSHTCSRCILRAKIYIGHFVQEILIDLIGWRALIVSHPVIGWIHRGRGAGGRWDFRFFSFGHFLGRFCIFFRRGFRFFPFLASGFSFFWQKQCGFSDFGDRCGFRFSQSGRRSKTNLHGLPMWFCGCRIINCLQVTFLISKACLLIEIYLFCRIWSEVSKIVVSRGWFSTLDSSLPSICFEDLVPLGDTRKVIQSLFAFLLLFY